jgi:RNA polymerase sporulation-specific sigma factor
MAIIQSKGKVVGGEGDVSKKGCHQWCQYLQAPGAQQKGNGPPLSRVSRRPEEAREELMQGNLRLVLSVLQRFNNRGEYVDDLFQVGCIGLMKAVDNFDPRQEVHFSTYAVPMIIGEIKRYLRDNSSLRVSRSLKMLTQKAQRIREKFVQENHREPRVEELAAELGVSPEDVAFIFNAGSDPISLYDTVFNDSTDPVYIMDVIADENNDGNKWIERLYPCRKPWPS